MQRLLLAIVVGLFGCGDTSGHPIDAPVDMPVDAPPPPIGHHHYVLDHVTLPATNEQARNFALDLDGDGQVDNQLGMVISTFAGMGIALDAMASAIDMGKIIMLGDLYATDFTAPLGPTFTMYQGTDPKPPACTGPQDMVCRHHLMGSATFSLVAGAPVDPPLAGALAGGVFTAGPGHLSVQLTFGGAPTTITMIGARVKLPMPGAASFTNGIVAGAISKTDIDGKLVPALHDGVLAIVMRDCTMLTNPPGCGCADASGGKTFIGLYDGNHDCDVSLDEVANNSFTMSLLDPDLTIDAMPALSFGMSTSAVGAGFVAPQ